MAAYYNEIDPFAVQWLRNLIAAGHIADGEVDNRSIEDVRPIDLMGFTQCHFFAGIGVWSYALRLAGWPDDRPVWTGSCPCQSFSAAGKGKGFADERHLWPLWLHLISQCRPDTIFGEQVEAAIKHGWLDLVQSDMEGVGYAVGAGVLPTAGCGAPHIRHRLWFVASKPENSCRIGRDRGRDGDTSGGVGEIQTQGRSGASGLANNIGKGLQGRLSGRADQEREDFNGCVRCDSANGGVGDYTGERCGEARPTIIDRPQERAADASAIDTASPTNGFWRDADWLLCRDGKFRPVEPGTFPLVDGATARVGRLRGYGNAIVAPLAAEFIKAYMEVRE